MEIGISSDMLIEVGLNMAGFICGGLLIMLLGTFRKSNRMAYASPANIPAIDMETASEADPETKRTSSKNDKSKFDGAFINFNKVDWRDEEPKPIETQESSESVRNRREVIKMAKQMLAEKRGESELRAQLPVNDGELSYTKYIEKLSNQGRK